MKNLLDKTSNDKEITSNKLIAVGVTLIILTLLIISGPAQAFVLGLTSDVDTAKQPEKIVFTASIDINANENLPIDELVLGLNGPEDVYCTFSIEGHKINNLGNCAGINIKKIAGPSINEGYGYGYGYDNSNNAWERFGYGYGYNLGYGYGYGYQYGYGYTEQTLTYEITLHTQHYDAGTYTSKLDVIIDGKTFSENGPSIEIQANPDNDDDDDDDYNGRGCRTDWICGEWSSCMDGEQIRQCTKENIHCYAADDRPDERRTCSIYDDGSDSGNIEEINLTGNSKKKGTSALSKITGAVTGTLGTAGSIVVVVFLITIAGGSIVVRRVRVRQRRGF